MTASLPLSLIVGPARRTLFRQSAVKISLLDRAAPENGCIIDMKWKLGSLSYHASAAGKEPVPLITEVIRLPELVLYDHLGFKGAFARTNLSFHYIGDYWNDRISCLIVVSGVWRFYRDDYYKGPYWDLGPGYYESFFAEKGPDDVVSSFQCIALT